MLIHSSAKFTPSEMGFHSQFELYYSEVDTQDEAVKNAIIKRAIEEMKEKCKSYFKVDFATMCFFEVYYFSKVSNEEVVLFRKEKK